MSKISIIIPVYNVERYIKRCLDSIIEQTYTDLEVILVDDGSSDHSVEICKEYEKKDSRISVVSKNNEGAGIARNVGISLSTGEYLGFVDADDYVEKEMYQVMVKSLEENNADLVYCLSTDESHEGYDNGTYKVFRGEDIENLAIGMIGTMPNQKKDSLYGSSVWRGLYKKQVVTDCNISFLSERTVASEDLLFNIEYLQQCQKAIYLDAALYHHCKNEASMTRTFGYFKTENELHLYRILEDILSRKGTKNFELPLKRMLIKRIRCAVLGNARAVNVKNVFEVIKITKDMLGDPFVSDVLKSYPGRQFEFRKRLMYCLMRYRMTILCLVIGKIFS